METAEVWLFDLDNTLYPASCDLFAEISRRMGEFVASYLGTDLASAKVIQKDFFQRHGTTLRGLMTEHGMEPGPFLDFVHDIDLSPLGTAPDLGPVLARLPGRKIIFTNGTVRHAERVLGALGILGHFEGIFDIVASDYRPKPEPEPYLELLSRFNARPETAVMVEDVARNLVPAARMGMATVWVPGKPEYSLGALDDPSHIHHVADDLGAFLAGIVDAAKVDREAKADIVGAKSPHPKGSNP